MKILINRHPDSIIREIGLDTYCQHFGMLVTPRSGSLPERNIELGSVWAVDNDAFVNFQRDNFIAMLQDLRSLAGSPLFVPCPDVVGDAAATQVRFNLWQPTLRYMGFPAALVAQDGLENLPIDWDSFDCLFIGGSTQWKLSEVAAKIGREAKRRGKWLHMGRVNSQRRLQYAWAIGCDSVDGSGFARFSRAMLPKAIAKLQNPMMPMLEL